MTLSEDRMRAYTRRLMLARLRILCGQGFYGLLLMHMRFALDESCRTAATDGDRIWFAPSFLDTITDDELEFVLMHEILHAALGHCLRTGERDGLQFNIACDIVVNSNILKSREMDLRSITLAEYGESMHRAPDGKEGYLYTAEQVYEMLPERKKKQFRGKNAARSAAGSDPAFKRKASAGTAAGCGKPDPGTASPEWDDHSRWGEAADPERQSELWTGRVQDAAEAVMSREPGKLPAFAERLLRELRKSRLDWRTILDAFVQEEVTDYSFSPPDRRFADGPFYLPDYSEKEVTARDILFLIDTSASMSDELITDAYSEVKGALDQFDGKLSGWLGFFDAAMIPPVPFEDVGDLLRIRPAGGGGTSFHCIFSYVQKKMADRLPASIIILTDGFAEFPQERAACGIPVLWLLNNDKVTPPWGKWVRMEPDRI